MCNSRGDTGAKMTENLDEFEIQRNSKINLNSLERNNNMFKDGEGEPVKRKWFRNPKALLVCLVFSGIVQGMIFTNVVISSLERRFGFQSTQSGLIAGSYDIGSLMAVVPVTYFGGRPGASKPKYIAAGMVIMGTGSLLFASPHLFNGRYLDSLLQSSDLLHLNPPPIAEKMTSEDLTPLTLALKVEKDQSRRQNFNPKLCRRSNDSIFPEENSSCEDFDGSDDAISMALWYQVIFVTAQIMHGVGAAALITLGTTLLDESVSRTAAPMYIGIFECSFVLGPALGYVVGGKLLTIFTEFYLLTDENYSFIFGQDGTQIPDFLQTDSTKWVGAWWLGFILIQVLSYLAAIALAFFPAVIPQKANSYHPNSEPQIIKNKSVEGDESEDDYVNLVKAMPKAIMSLLTNATYMFITVGSTMDGFLLAGMAAFLPKFFEAQFRLSAGMAAMMVGAVVIPAGAGGTLLGGYLGKRLGLKRSGLIRMYVACQCVVLPLYLGFLLYCENEPFAGVTTAHVSDFVHFNNGSFDAACNAECNLNSDSSKGGGCSRSAYDPVCSVVDGVTFFSPCVAGCSAANLDENGEVFYTDCACTSNIAGSQSISDLGGLVVKDRCESGNCSYLLFCAVLFFQVFFVFCGAMPGLVASLRSVHQHERSLAIGLQTMFMRAIGTIPGPIIFGVMMDGTCLLWHEKTEEDLCSIEDSSATSSTSGACLIYDNASMAKAVLVTSVVWRSIGAVFFGIAGHFSRSSKVPEDEDPRQAAEVVQEQLQVEMNHRVNINNKSNNKNGTVINVIHNED